MSRDPYCTPRMVAMRRAAPSVCIDEDCELSGYYAHAGPCEPCDCGKRHAIAECDAREPPPPDPRDAELARLRAIVAEFAESDPIEAIGWSFECGHCGEGHYSDPHRVAHANSCPWIRARAEVKG